MKIASRQDLENIHLLILITFFALIFVTAGLMSSEHSSRSSTAVEAPAVTALGTNEIADEALEQLR